MSVAIRVVVVAAMRVWLILSWCWRRERQKDVALG